MNSFFLLRFLPPRPPPVTRRRDGAIRIPPSYGERRWPRCHRTAPAASAGEREHSLHTALHIPATSSTSAASPTSTCRYRAALSTADASAGCCLGRRPQADSAVALLGVVATERQHLRGGAPGHTLAVALEVERGSQLACGVWEQRGNGGGGGGARRSVEAVIALCGAGRVGAWWW